MIKNLILLCYRHGGTFLRRRIIILLTKRERGTAHSSTLREIFKKYHDLEVGMYSQGWWCQLNAIDRGVKIGRYCSIASNTRIMNWNHPLDHKSTHSIFFDPALGYVKDIKLERTMLEIGNDVWIGHGAIIMPGVSQVGDGAVIGAGAVVNKNVPPYAIVVGNPGRVVRYRFSQGKIEELLAEKWWEKDIEQLIPHLDQFTTALEPSEGYPGGES